MTLSRKSINSGLAIGAGTAFIALIGMLTVFQGRFIITGVLPLSTIILAGLLLAAGYVAARRLPADSGRTSQLANGALAGAVTVLVMVAAVLVATQINAWALGLTMDPVLPNVNDALRALLALGQEQPLVGYVLLAGLGLLLGAAGSQIGVLSNQVKGMTVQVILIIIVLGMLQDQINSIISLLDAVWITLFVTLGYAIAVWRNHHRLVQRLVEPLLIGAVAAIVGGLLLLAGGANATTAPALFGSPAPAILSSFILGRSTVGMLVLLAVAGGALSAVGGLISCSSAGVHRATTTLLASLLTLGILNSTKTITLPAAIVIAIILVATQLLTLRTAARAQEFHSEFKPDEKRTNQILVAIAGLAFALILPQLMTNYINNVLGLIGLYIMMGLGLNIQVGFAGMLNLGYVAFFAIGAYTVGILTTPNTLTCGGVSPIPTSPQDIAAVCTGITTFWIAWPFAILASGIAGLLVSVPVLGLRGDYLAIVTLGFGEIIRIVTLSDAFKPYLGGAQGIVNISPPVIDLTGISASLVNTGLPLLSDLGRAVAQPLRLTQATDVYYLILAGIVVTMFISYRLSNSRLGRAWRAMRSDETVAQAMGINLVRTKLLAFFIGAAFAGVGGALFGSYIRSIFPNSFTLIVSINVLSLIIIGGLGSLPGVLIGAAIIFGLPEALREFQEFRLLMFGALLVVMMLIRPEGIIPPSTPRLEDQAQKALAEEGA